MKRPQRKKKANRQRSGSRRDGVPADWRKTLAREARQEPDPVPHNRWGSQNNYNKRRKR